MWLRPWQRRASAKVRVCDPVLPPAPLPLFSFLFFLSFLLLFLFLLFSFSPAEFGASVGRSRFGIGSALRRRVGLSPLSGKGLQASCSLRSFFLLFLSFLLLLFSSLPFWCRKKKGSTSADKRVQDGCQCARAIVDKNFFYPLRRGLREERGC